jgi:hypothetical protein
MSRLNHSICVCPSCPRTVIQTAGELLNCTSSLYLDRQLTTIPRYHPLFYCQFTGAAAFISPNCCNVHMDAGAKVFVAIHVLKFTLEDLNTNVYDMVQVCVKNACCSTNCACTVPWLAFAVWLRTQLHTTVVFGSTKGHHRHARDHT